jgi:hypothetical protein
MAESYDQNILFHSIGEDFYFMRAFENFRVWDMIIEYINSHQ